MVKRVALGRKLDTAASSALRDELLTAADSDIVLDGAEVEQLGALCLEVILSVVALWPKSGHSVSLENPSSQMVDDLGRFGLTPDTLLECAA